jgi:transcriptional regulator with XRE-family HTH domain
MGSLTPPRRAAVADLHVGRRLRERRVQRGLSLAALAEALGVSTQQLRKYEAGVNGVPAARLPDLGLLLGVPPAWFFEELDDTAGAYRPLLPTRPRMLLDLVRATDELPDSGLVALCEAARALAPMNGEG